MIMINAGKKGSCGFEPGKNNRWVEDPAIQTRTCEGAPQRIPAAEFEGRQRQLATCFERAGKEEEACTAFADEASAQYDKAVEAQCGFDESRKWNSSKARHYVWCLDASQKEREDLSFERDDEIAECRRLASQRKACDDVCRERHRAGDAQRERALRAARRGLEQVQGRPCRVLHGGGREGRPPAGRRPAG